jgi:molybdopterin molybdotransferase
MTLDDCFAAGSDLMPLADALDILAEKLGPEVGTEVVPLSQALSRTLAHGVTAPRSVPPHDNSAVDGYAVFFDDLDGETRLPVTARVSAGHPLRRPARPGEALRIFTGAPMPAGPDTVVMEEDCRTDGEHVILSPGIKRGANRRFAGEDVKEGSLILRPGRLLRPQEIGLAASIGCRELTVYKRLRAAVFSTGDEVRDPGTEAGPGCIFDSNRYIISGLLRGLGCEVADLGILPDDEGAIRRALDRAAADNQLLITSGGISLGQEDHVKAAVESLGHLHFWRLAIKPGRPIALGEVKGKTFVGLPGNPVAAMVTFILIARPVVLLLAGRTDIRPDLFRVPAGFDHPKKLGRREWVRARLQPGADGVLEAVKFPAGGAGILTSMVEADGLVELPEDQGPVAKGAMVDFLPFSGVST